MIGATLFLLFMTADVTGQVKPPDGCQPIRLRQTGAQCYAAEVDGVAYRVRLSIWDDARPASPAVFCLPARYGRAEVRAERWGPAGTDVLVARIVGDSGTAALQTVGVGIGWVGSGYGLVLFETLDYTLGGRRLTGRMAHAGGRLVLSYDYTDAPYMEPDRPTLRTAGSCRSCGMTGRCGTTAPPLAPEAVRSPPGSPPGLRRPGAPRSP